MKKNGKEHLIDAINKWVDADEATHECFCVLVRKDENEEDVFSGAIIGGGRLISAIVNLMEKSEAAREILLIALKAFTSRQMEKMHEDKDITLN